MYKVGQRVKVISIEGTRWQNFNHLDKERMLNKIFKIVDDLGTSGDEHAWRLETPFGVYNFVEFQFRALKKKGAMKEAKIAKVTFKSEVEWLNKVKENFKNAGKIQTELDDAIHAYRTPGLIRDVFARTEPAQPRRAGLQGVPLPIPVMYNGEERGIDEAQDVFVDEDREEGNGN
jgi:hypothetical protein